MSPIPLHLATTEVVQVAAPFHPRTTLIKPSHFPSPFDLQTERSYQAVPLLNGKPVGVRASFDDDDTSSVRIAIYLPDGADLDADVPSVLRRRLGLELAVPGYAQLCQRDDVLSRLPTQMHGARPSSPWSLYEYLTIGTILQNTNIARTVQMADALAQRLSTWYSFPDGTVLASFWEPRRVVELGEQALRDAKLGYRAKILTRVGAQFLEQPDLEKSLWKHADDPDVLRSRLRAIYGVGPATTGYLMFDIFKCLDEFTYLPPWEAKILGKLLFDDQEADPAQTIKWCHERWAPYTMLAVHAVFEAVFWHRSTGKGPAWLDELIRL